MDSRSIQVLLGSFAEQQYLFHLLTRLLTEKGIIKDGELMRRYNEKERYQFSHDLLEHLVASGLKMDENSLSSSHQEPPGASPPAATEAIDPESEKKS